MAVAISKMRMLFIVGQFILCLLLTMLVVGFAWEFAMRYSMDYGEAGSHFDDRNVVVYHEQALPVIGVFLALSFLALAVAGRWTLKTVQSRSRKKMP